MSKAFLFSRNRVVVESDDGKSLSMLPLSEVRQNNKLGANALIDLEVAKKLRDTLTEFTLVVDDGSGEYTEYELPVVDGHDVEDQDNYSQSDDEIDDDKEEEEQSISPTELKMIRGVSKRLLGKRTPKQISESDSDEWNNVKNAVSNANTKEKIKKRNDLASLAAKTRAEYEAAAEVGKDHIETVQGNRNATMAVLLGDIEKLLRGDQYKDFVQLQSLLTSMGTDLYDLVPKEIKDYVMTGGKGVRSLSDMFKTVKENVDVTHIQEMAMMRYRVNIVGPIPDGLEDLEDLEITIAGRSMMVDTVEEKGAGKFSATGTFVTRRAGLTSEELKHTTMLANGKQFKPHSVKIKEVTDVD